LGPAVRPVRSGPREALVGTPVETLAEGSVPHSRAESRPWLGRYLKVPSLLRTE